MPTGQNYATNVPQTQLTSSINATATSMSVVSATGWPSPPFTAVIDLGSASQEPVDVTAVVGTSFTITRSIDGTSAFAHTNGATVTHGDIGRDFREPRAHIDAAASPDATGHAVHGLNNASSVVGTTDSQTLTNKTLTSPQLTGAVTGAATYNSTSVQVFGVTGANAQAFRLMGTTIFGPPTTGTFTVGDVVFDELGNLWFCTASGTPGVWMPVGGRALVTTLSGSSAAYSFAIPTGLGAKRIEVFWRGSSTAAVHNQVLKLILNGDAGANYQFERTESNNTTVSAATFAAQNSIQIGSIGGSLNTANYRGSGYFVIEGLQDGTGFATVVGTATLFDTSANMFNGTYSGQHLQSSTFTGGSLSPASGAWDANSYLAAYAVF